MGLVYVTFELANQMVADLTTDKYNTKDTTLVVVNALNGTIPLVLKEKFPLARIVCAEYFDFFADHLNRLGFEVIKWNQRNKWKKEQDMNVSVVLGNPPYNSNDTSRELTQHRGQGNNLAKKFTLESLTFTDDRMIFVIPYGHRTYSPKLQEEFRKNGLFKITPCMEYFKNVSTNPCAFHFNKKEIVEEIDDQYSTHGYSIPTNNIGQIFKNQPGSLNRIDYEHKLTDAGKYRIVVTTGVIKYTDDKSIVDGMKDNTQGNWRVVFNCTTSIGKFGKIIVEGPDSILSKSVHCLVLSDKQSAINIKTYLETAEVKKILEDVKIINACNSKKFLQYIPMPE